MILTVTLNPCIDLTVTVPNLELEGTNRIIRVREDIGGKGINVGTALHQLGYSAKCLGINFEINGDKLDNGLKEVGIPYEFILEKGRLRTNVKIFDQMRRSMTELNETGSTVSETTLELLKKKIRKYSTESAIVVLAGSVPEGVPGTIYRDIARITGGQGAKVVVDARKELLSNALCGDVYLIKPNLLELEEIIGRPLQSADDLIQEIRKINDLGVRYVCVTLGKHGAFMISKEECWYVSAPDVTVKGIQGAGDSMVAGLCIAMEKNLTSAEMIRYGTAVTGGSLTREGTQMCTKEDFENLLSSINPTPVPNNFKIPLFQDFDA